jgi:hypothetical protein
MNSGANNYLLWKYLNKQPGYNPNTPAGGFQDVGLIEEGI